MSKGKNETTEEITLKQSIKKEKMYKYMGILESDSIKQTEIEKKSVKNALKNKNKNY